MSSRTWDQLLRPELVVYTHVATEVYGLRYLDSETKTCRVSRGPQLCWLLVFSATKVVGYMSQAAGVCNHEYCRVLSGENCWGP